MTSSVQFSLGSEIKKALASNSSLNSRVQELGQEVQALFAAKLDQLLADASSEGTFATQNGAGESTNSEPQEANASIDVASSTLSFLNTANATAAVSTSAASTWSAPWMAGSESAADLLYSNISDALSNKSSKPGIREFMDATGASLLDTQSVLYGTVGSLTDMRDWSKIMQSADPLLAARQATGAMYTSPSHQLPQRHEEQIALGTVNAQTPNLTWSNNGQFDILTLTDLSGNPLRQMPMNTPDILQTMQDFGVDPSQFSELADQLDAQGIKYKPYEYRLGSDAGVDFHQLGSGNPLASMGHDWRADANIALKGADAAARLQQVNAMAQSWGLS